MKKTLALFALGFVTFTANAQSTLKGDMNDDGEKNITDVMLLVDDILHNAKPSPYTSCPDNNHPHAISLGLSVKWACCNVDADKPEANGGYYAWGETKEKNYYSWDNYTHCDGNYNSCVYLDDIAGTQYDVAHVKWGGKWVMPSIEQIQELIVEADEEWTTVNGVDVVKITGKNGESIFIPAAGYRVFSNKSEHVCCYWSSTQDPSTIYNAYQGGVSGYSTSQIFTGCNVRPVWVP